MATWIAHLRIAENILNEIENLDVSAFAAGNIAPDSGVPNGDWSSFDPPGSITHWKNSEGRIEADAFFKKYVAVEPAASDDEFSFLLGYYVHLLADIEWERFYRTKWEEPLHKKLRSEDPGYIWRVKEDWYGQDFDYLKENEHSIFFTCFQHITEVKDYLDYFPKGAFNKRFRYIREMYQEHYREPQKEYIYLPREEMDRYVSLASANILSNIRDKGF